MRYVGSVPVQGSRGDVERGDMGTIIDGVLGEIGLERRLDVVRQGGGGG